MRHHSLWYRRSVHSQAYCLVATKPAPDTNNIVNHQNGGYEHVTEYIPIGQPNAGTLAKLQALQPSTKVGDRKQIPSLVPAQNG